MYIFFGDELLSFFIFGQRQLRLLALILPLIFKKRSLDIRHLVIVWNIKCVVRKSTGSSWSCKKEKFKLKQRAYSDTTNTIASKIVFSKIQTTCSTKGHVKRWRLTSPATLASVSRPSCRSEMNMQCAQRRRKRRHVRFTASCLTLVSSKDRFLRMMATCSTRWPSTSEMPMFRWGWNSKVCMALCSVPSGGNKRPENLFGLNPVSSDLDKPSPEFLHDLYFCKLFFMNSFINLLVKFHVNVFANQTKQMF